jgi:type IV secretion system protein VirB4
VVLNFLAAQAQRLRPRTILFDKDRGSEIFVRAIGGRYSTLRAGEPSGFNPLQLEDSEAARSFLRIWAAQLVATPGTPLAPEDYQLIAEAVDANFAQQRTYRRIRYFRELLGGAARPSQGDLLTRLAPWCGTGERAWVFDNAEDQLDDAARIVGFDITEVLNDPAVRTPVMMYAFHRIEERLDGQPVMILIDEGWKALDDEVFAARIRDWMKTLRKRGAILGFGTQNARDALDSRIAAAVVEQAATQIFMPNPKAQAADYCAGFGLTSHELAIIRSLSAQSRCFLVKQGVESAVVRLDLSNAPDILTMLSGRESSVRRLDDIRIRRGDRVEDWWPELIGTPYPGDAILADRAAAKGGA